MQPLPTPIVWYRIFLGFLALIYLAMAGIGIGLIFFPAEVLDMQPVEKIVFVAVCAGMGLPLALACLVPFFFSPKPWLWIYGLVMIAIGMTSCCFWPICIPLLVYWIKPDIQAYFGRK